MPSTSRSRRIPGAIIGRPPGEPTTVVRLPLRVATLARGLVGRRYRYGDLNAFLDVEARTAATVPLMSSRAACGFPSPADDYLEGALDFNQLLVVNPAATFAVRVAGESMTGAGIFPGDIAIIDRSIRPFNGCVVLACVEGEFTIKRYRAKGGQIVLQAENAAFKDIVIPEDAEFEVWGVVKHAIRHL